MLQEKMGHSQGGVRGVGVLRDPALNKGTAFTEAERDALNLRGLLPPHVSSQADQVARVLENFRRKSTDLEKFIDLAALHDRNEALFFRILMDNPDEMTPIVYTPTVGLACQQFGHIFQRPRGIFVSAKDRGRVASVLANWPNRDVKIIVVSDGAAARRPALHRAAPEAPGRRGVRRARRRVRHRGVRDLSGRRDPVRGLRQP